MSPQERAALFPSRSVSSSPLPPPTSLSSSSSSRRASTTGKRQGIDSPSSASSYRSHLTTAQTTHPRGSKRVKEDRRRDRRCSFGYTDDSGHLLSNADDEREDSFITASPSPPSSSRLTLLLGSTSSSSLSSLDSPSYSSYPSATAPLNSPVSGGLRRRFCHIEQHDLLGTAAAAANVARRGATASLYGSEEDEGDDLVDAVGKFNLRDSRAYKHPTATAMAEEKEQPSTADDDDDDAEVARQLPAAPRLPTRSTSLRVNVVAAGPVPVASDGDEDVLADDDGLVVELSPMGRGEGASSSSGSGAGSGAGFSDFIRTGSFSQALRSARRQAGLGSSRASSSEGSPFPGTPEPVLSPLSSSLAAPPVSPSASGSSASQASSSALPAARHAPTALSPFTLLPATSPLFARSLSMGVDPVRRSDRGENTGRRPTLVSSARRRGDDGDSAAGDVVPFLKELSLPTKTSAEGEAGGGMLARIRANRAGRMEVQTGMD